MYLIFVFKRGSHVWLLYGDDKISFSYLLIQNLEATCFIVFLCDKLITVIQCFREQIRPRSSEDNNCDLVMEAIFEICVCWLPFRLALNHNVCHSVILMGPTQVLQTLKHRTIECFKFFITISVCLIWGPPLKFLIVLVTSEYWVYCF